MFQAFLRGVLRIALNLFSTRDAYCYNVSKLLHILHIKKHINNAAYKMRGCEHVNTKQ